MVAALFLAACANPGGILPGSRVLTTSTLDAGSAIRNSAVAPWTDEAWWHIYGDPQLDSLVDMALAGNPSIKIALDRIGQAEAVAGNARSALLPTVDAKGDFLRVHSSYVGETPPPLNGAEFWDANLGAQLSFDLDIWGRNRATLDSTLGSLRAAELDARVSTLSLQTAVVHAYLQLSYAYALDDVLEATLTQRQQVLNITRRRHDAGLLPQLQVSQAETEIAPVRVQLEQTGNRIVILRNQLAALTGSGPGSGETMTRPRLALTTEEVSLPSTIPAELLGRRPDVVAARWRVESAGYGIDAARAAFYPNVNLSAFLGLQSLSLDELLQARAATFGVAPAITLPLFEGGKLRANLAGRTAAYNLAVDDYNQTVLNAMHEVADQIATVGSTARQRQQSVAAVASAQRAYGQAQQGFHEGLTDFLTVLSTQTALLARQQELAQIAASELDSRASLMQALGGGFHDEDGSEQLMQKTIDTHPAMQATEAAPAAEAKP